MRRLLATVAVALAAFAHDASASFKQQAARAIWQTFPKGARGRALRVSRCETGGFEDQLNEKSGAKGIFQVIPGNDNRVLYDWRTGRFALRIAYERLYDMAYSARVAYYLSHGGRDWSEWDCRWAA